VTARRGWLSSVDYVITPSSHDPASLAAPLREQFESVLGEHRRALYDCLDGMTEEEARCELVPSKTTLLGLVKHATFVELVWFNEAITCRSRTEIGCPPGPDESFELDPNDTTDSVRATYGQACDASRAAAANLGIDDVVNGNRRGPLPMRWIYLHAVRELAQHCGHADILREQIIASRSAGQG
jgi:Protein of unknown function (DUF664)